MDNDRKGPTLKAAALLEPVELLRHGIAALSPIFELDFLATHPRSTKTSALAVFPYCRAARLAAIGPKHAARRLGPEVERIIERALRQHYLVPEPPSFLRIFGEIPAERAASGSQSPTCRTIEARLNAMDQRDVIWKRVGPKTARQNFEARAVRTAPVSVPGQGGMAAIRSQFVTIQ